MCVDGKKILRLDLENIGMENTYIFRKIKKEEIPQMFHLVQERIKWMDKNGIRQWYVTNYAEVFPQSRKTLFSARFSRR